MIKTVERNNENECLKLDKKIDEFEQNTLWKIKDYVALLAQRPTTQFMEDAIKSACAGVKQAARTYTDMELEKFKQSESASKLISFFKIEIAEQHKHL